jgi:hypothetical protein
VHILVSVDGFAQRCIAFFEDRSYDQRGYRRSRCRSNSPRHAYRGHRRRYEPAAFADHRPPPVTRNEAQYDGEACHVLEWIMSTVARRSASGVESDRRYR